MDTKSSSLTTAERIKNNGVLILGFIGSVIALFIPVLSDVDFSTLNGIYAAIPTIAAALGRLQAFGPVTVEKLKEQGEV